MLSGFYCWVIYIAPGRFMELHVSWTGWKRNDLIRHGYSLKGLKNVCPTALEVLRPVHGRSLVLIFFHHHLNRTIMLTCIPDHATTEQHPCRVLPSTMLCLCPGWSYYNWNLCLTLVCILLGYSNIFLLFTGWLQQYAIRHPCLLP